jgi:hypothetical protein
MASGSGGIGSISGWDGECDVARACRKEDAGARWMWTGWTVASGWSVVGIKLAGAGSRLQVVVRIGEVK